LGANAQLGLTSQPLKTFALDYIQAHNSKSLSSETAWRLKVADCQTGSSRNCERLVLFRPEIP